MYAFKKYLYGLKQEPRAWYGRIDGFLMKLDFTKSKDDSKIYYKVENDGIMILLLYVNAIFFKITENLICECNKKLVPEFEMKHLSTMLYFLGLEV